MGREIKSIPSMVMFAAKARGPADSPFSWQSFRILSIAKRLTSFSVPAWESPTNPNSFWRKPSPTFFFGSVLLWLTHTPITLPTILRSFGDRFFRTFINTCPAIDAGFCVDYGLIALHLDGLNWTTLFARSAACAFLQINNDRHLLPPFELSFLYTRPSSHSHNILHQKTEWIPRSESAT